MNTLLLGGNVDDRDERIQLLENENEALRNENAELGVEVRRIKAENGKAIAALRTQLTPLYRALQMVFGQIEAIGGTETTSSDNSANSKWETG